MALSKVVKNIDDINIKEKISIVFLDVDGTIIPLDNTFSEAQVPKSVIEASKILDDIPLVLVTGRALNEIRNVASVIGNEKNLLHIIAWCRNL